MNAAGWRRSRMIIPAAGHYQDETGTVQPYPANGSATEHSRDIDHLLEQSLSLYTNPDCRASSPTILYELSDPAVHWLSKQMANHGLRKVHYQNEKLNLTKIRRSAVSDYSVADECDQTFKVTDADIYITQNEMDCGVAVADKGWGLIWTVGE